MVMNLTMLLLEMTEIISLMVNQVMTLYLVVTAMIFLEVVMAMIPLGAEVEKIRFMLVMAMMIFTLN